MSRTQPCSSAARTDGNDVSVEVLGQPRAGGGVGYGIGELSHGLSSTVSKELEEIERACQQRSSSLLEEEKFVETLGRVDDSMSS